MSRTGRPVRVVSTGDVMFQDRLASSPRALAEGAAGVFAALKQADLSFINCEMSLSRGGYPTEKRFNIRADPTVAHDLRALGVNVATLANNHMLDFGYDGLFETLEALDSAGVGRVGAGRNVEEAVRPHFREVHGHRFAFLGVASTLPPGFAASPNRPGVAPVRVIVNFEALASAVAETPGAPPTVRTRAVQEDVDRITGAIEAARREADHVIVGIHWGMTRGRATPLQGQIAEYQQPLGRAFVDAGADLVVGNHSHNLLGVEVYRGKPIFYSLGQFIFQRPYAFDGVLGEPETALLLADFEGSAMRVRLAPVLLDAEGFPGTAAPADRDRIAELIVQRSKRFGTRFSLDAEGVEVELT